MTYDANKIGKIIKYERKSRKWSQEKLGGKVNISGKQISKYESGELPPLEMLLKLCDLFECELGYLLGEETYAEGTSFDTLIVKETGLSIESINNIKRITGKANKSITIHENFESYTALLNRLLSSNEFLRFFSSLADLNVVAENVNTAREKYTKKFPDDIRIEAENLYLCQRDYLHVNGEDEIGDEIANAMNALDSLIDNQRDYSFNAKVCKYDLMEKIAFLIDEMFPNLNNL